MVRDSSENCPKPDFESFPWPPLSARSPSPRWTGHGFQVGDHFHPVLSYEVGSSGWTDELTSFHEEAAGGDHFIDLASRDHALAQLKKHLNGSCPVILEVGCSSGFMLRHIQEEMPGARLMGADYVVGPLLKLAGQTPHIPLLQFDLTQCPLPTGSVDAVVMLNVLEHIQDDAAALRQVHRILKPGGIAVIEVPAGPHLYDAYDRLLMHHRRYSYSALRKLVQKANLKILSQSHLGFFLYPGFWWVKKSNRKFISLQKALPQQLVAQNIAMTKKSRFLSSLMGLELTLGKYLSYPFGIRCLMTCSKQGDDQGIKGPGVS